jgi:hypothetical protein
VKKLRVLEIIFDSEINSHQIPAFRGAVAAKAGLENVLFHNHVDDNFRYNYPFIQYKRLNKCASIICVEQGVDEIHHFFSNPDWSLNLNGEKFEMKIQKLQVNSFNINVWDKYFSYKIFNWLALNEENYKKYLTLDSLSEKLQLLENIFTANILSFAKGIELYLEKDKKIEVKIQNIINEKIIKFKNINKKSFDIEFKTNVFLPQHIGLGKAASHGYGVVYVNKGKD